MIPITLFPSGGERWVEVNLTLPPGTPPERTLAEVMDIEEHVRDISDIYASIVGATDLSSGGISSSFNQASLVAILNSDAPEDTAGYLREKLKSPGRQLQDNRVAGRPTHQRRRNKCCRPGNMTTLPGYPKNWFPL